MQVIPQLIHQTWKNTEIPISLRKFQQSWKNCHPDWEYRLWTDEDNRQFLATNYPWFLDIYDGYTENICRVDAVRYFILMQYGGVFIDLDFECLRPLDSLLQDKELVLGLEPHEHVMLPQAQARQLKQIICPSLIASRPRHPFWQDVCQYLVENQHLPGVLDTTGPFLLTRAYDSSSSKSSISLVESELLYPATKFDCWHGKLQNSEFRQKITKKAFAIHHWEGSWFRSPQVQMLRATKDMVTLSLLIKGRVTLKSQFRFNLYQSLTSQTSELPLISCLMVTKCRFEQAKLSIKCFQNQTHPHKELIIIDDDESDLLAQYVNQLADKTIRHIYLESRGQTLGELRNLALANASGHYVCQWDDDDLADPLRLEMQLATLQALNAEACFLQRWLIWWIDRQRLATSRTRIWEGSILCRKDKFPLYSAQRKGEDTIVSSQILQNCRVVLLDQPQLYLYVVHRKNTFNEKHFEPHWQQASDRFTEQNYQQLLTNLAERMPVLDYLQIGKSNSTANPQTIDRQDLELEQSTNIHRNLVSDFVEPTQLPKILILTPVKNAISVLPQYLKNLKNLSYPHELISIGFLESDSSDGSFDWLQQHLIELRQEFNTVTLKKHDFEFHPTLPRWSPDIQFQRRSILAKSRNRLLQQALQNEDWVLWLDADVIDYPPDVIQQLLATEKDIIVPHCVVGSERRSFDLNSFKFKPGAKFQDWSSFVINNIIQPPRGEGRLYLEDLREQQIIEVDSVGATMLLIRADLHRDGLIFPPFSYKQYIETEGLAMLAQDMGYSCWGLPNLEILHNSI